MGRICTSPQYVEQLKICIYIYRSSELSVIRDRSIYMPEEGSYEVSNILGLISGCEALLILEWRRANVE